MAQIYRLDHISLSTLTVGKQNEKFIDISRNTKITSYAQAELSINPE